MRVTGELQPIEDQGWWEVRHFACVARPYEQVRALLDDATELVLGGDEAARVIRGAPELRLRRAGLERSRTVRLRLGSLSSDERRAKMALRWEDAEHPHLFPTFEAVLELAPVAAGRDQLTHLSLIAHHRPPLGALGALADRLGGRQVASQAVAWWAGEIARRLESMTTDAGRTLGQPA
jgi:hypothetical protein